MGLALVLTVLLLQESASDAYLRGRVESLVAYEFPGQGLQVRVARGAVTVIGDLNEPKDRARLEKLLEKIPGFRSLDFAPPDEKEHQIREVEVAAARPPFHPLLADPRTPHFSGTVKTSLRSHSIVQTGGAATFGEYFGLMGWDDSHAGRFQFGFQAGVFALFDLEADSYDLINADYLIGLPLQWSRGPFSAQLRAFHISSHLGDEFLLRGTTGRVNLGYEVLDLKVSFEASALRVYGGAGYLFHSDPEDIEHGSLQFGSEWAPALGWLDDAVDPVAAVDLQWHEESDWAFDLSVRAGLAFRGPTTGSRRVLLLLEYYLGRSPDGQFYLDRVETLGFGIHLYF